FVVNTILKEADLFCPNSVRINFTIYHTSISRLFSQISRPGPGVSWQPVDEIDRDFDQPAEGFQGEVRASQEEGVSSNHVLQITGTVVR
ncbi:hypothetical protein ABQ284_06615, partial [Lentilactobacillus buchneri]